MLLCDSTETLQIEEHHLSELFTRRVDGILLACCVGSKTPETMLRRRFPVVFVDRLPLAAAGVNTVCTDNIRAGQLATEHVVGLGHKRIGMLAGHLELSPHRDRLEGFRKTMQEEHLPILDEYLISGNVQVEDGLAAGRRLLDLPNPPTAILATNNKLLLGMLQAVDERKILIPEQLSVLAFDDYLWNKHFNPTLTAVAQPTHLIGQKSFELLLQLIQNPTVEVASPIHLRLTAELHVRNSTAPPHR